MHLDLTNYTDVFLCVILLKSLLVFGWYYSNHSLKISTQQLKWTQHISVVYGCTAVGHWLLSGSYFWQLRWIVLLGVVVGIEAVIWKIEPHLRRVAVLVAEKHHRSLDVPKTLRDFNRDKALFIYLPYWCFLIWLCA